MWEREIGKVPEDTRILLSTPYPFIYTDTIRPYTYNVSNNYSNILSGGNAFGRYNMYGYMAEHEWKTQLMEAYKEMFFDGKLYID